MRLRKLQHTFPHGASEMPQLPTCDDVKPPNCVCNRLASACPTSQARQSQRIGKISSLSFKMQLYFAHNICNVKARQSVQSFSSLPQN
eukprot:2851928-Amphidinium_carterae.1